MDDMKKEAQWLLTEKYWGMETEAYKRDLARLRQGEPLAYLIGHIPFLDTTIFLDSRPLIPRAETEFWVEIAIRELKARGEPLSILDLCAGSGCIGVAVLKALPSATVDFAEINMLHHRTIRKNLLENAIELARTAILGGDLFERTHKRYDCILSNPPYIDPKLDRTEESVRKYEPNTALYGGEEGIAFIARIIAEADNHLEKDGVLYLEHEQEHSERIRELADAHGFVSVTHADQYGVLRFTRISRAM